MSDTKVTSLTALASGAIDNANDFIPVVDVSDATMAATGTDKKITPNNFLSNSPTIVTPTIASFANATHTHADAAGGGALTHTAFPAGAVVQVVSTGSSAVATGTTVTPLDDTIPQITEGTEFMTQAITPKSATNVLVIQVTAQCAFSGAAGTLIASLFQDATSDALSATAQATAGADFSYTLRLTHTMVAGTTSSTTFRVRVGNSASGTVSFNGAAAARLFGAITKSSIVITEYKA